MSIGIRIKQLRLVHGLSQKELASAIGISAPSLSDIENEITKSLKADTLLALSKALSCSPYWIYYGRDDNESIKEYQLIEIFRVLDNPHQDALIALAKETLAQQKNN